MTANHRPKTTIRMLLGLLTPSAGSATALGTSVSHPADYLDRVGAPIEASAFYPTLSGRNDLEVLAALGGLRREWVAFDPLDGPESPTPRLSSVG